jgi:uncharacterized OB-fold protein
MGEVYSRQKIQEDFQRSDEFVDVFSKIVSGKAGYKAVVEVKPITSKCPGCGTNLDERQKFCHECGAKNEHFRSEKK